MRGARLVRGIDRVLTPDRLLVYPVVILVAFTVVWVISLLRGALLLPDFLARWTAGRMLLGGDARSLYDRAAQHVIQEPLAGDSLSWFVSPPPVAMAAVPLGALPYPVAAALWMMAMLGALILAARLAAGLHPGLRPLASRRGGLIAAASLPFLELVGGGQDTAIFVLALVAAARLMARDQDLLAGVTLSLFIGKPHLAILMPVALLVLRRWRVLLAALLAGVAWIVLSIVALGLRTWETWFETVTSPFYQTQVSEAQAWKMVSLRAFTHQLLPPSVHGAVSLGVWLVLASIVVVTFVRATVAQPSSHAPVVFVAYLPITTLLVTAHAPVYELVLVIPGACLAVTRIATPWVRTQLVSAFVLSAVNPSLHTLGGTEWPRSVLGAGWVVLPLVAIWRALGRCSATGGMSDPKRSLHSEHEDPRPAINE